MPNKIIRRPHISWSQLSMWENDPNGYKLRYVDNIPLPESQSLKIGKYVADELEKKVSKDKLVEFLRMFSPTCELREEEFNVALGKIMLKGFMDGFNPSIPEIEEFKTGINWTQGKVNKHGQLDFYALAYYLKYKSIPKVNLIWFRTARDSNGNIFLTGELPVIFPREIKLRDILRMSARIKKADKEIQAMYDFLNE